MRFFGMIRRLFCTVLLITLFVSPCLAEGVSDENKSFTVVDAGLDLTGEISVHYPVLTGDGEIAGQVNALIQEKTGAAEYLSRAARLMVSGGSLKTEWRGGVMGGVLSAAVSAEGAVESSRSTYLWTAVTVDLRDGHEIAFAELFTDEEAAREAITSWLEETVAPDLSAHLLNSELTPLPETFLIEQSGLTLMYPVSRLSTLSDRAGDIRVGWNVLRDVLDLDEDSIPVRIGAEDMITMSARSAERLRADASEGSLTDIPVKIGDSMQELTDRWHMLTDPDGFEGGRLFFLEGGCFRGVSLMTDDLDRKWEKSKVKGIRMDQGCLWGLCPGETPRSEWLTEMGIPDRTAEIDAEKAEMNRLVPGVCDYYRCGDYLLQLCSDEEETLVSIILTL